MPQTPYNLDGSVDLQAFDAHVEHQLANGVEVSLPTTLAPAWIRRVNTNRNTHKRSTTHAHLCTPLAPPPHQAFIIGGTTGEGHLFNWTEHIMLIAHTKHKFGDRCFVVS